jgi:hypothetical protein
MYFVLGAPLAKFVDVFHILQLHLLPLYYIPRISQISFIIFIVVFHSIPYNVS